jgi:hypothetical protein
MQVAHLIKYANLMATSLPTISVTQGCVPKGRGHAPRAPKMRVLQRECYPPRGDNFRGTLTGVSCCCLHERSCSSSPESNCSHCLHQMYDCASSAVVYPILLPHSSDDRCTMDGTLWFHYDLS